MPTPSHNPKKQNDIVGYRTDYRKTNNRFNSVEAKTTSLQNQINALPTTGTTKTIIQQVPSPSSSTGLTSVGITLPTNTFSWTPATLVNNGSIAVSYLPQSANTFLRGPTTGAAATPTWGALVVADIPALSAITAVIPLAKITPVTGTDGSISITNGIVTAYLAPT